ncbi:MAG: proline racemase family protein [Bryobacteraceae bacterium]
MQRVQVIDSHTAGEPTRVVIGGGPDLGPGTVAERLERFRSSFDWFRSAVVNEPRGNDAMVGALLCEPADPTCDAGVIFFNNVGYLNMCGHGTMGLVVTLAHLGRIRQGGIAQKMLRIETNCGVVEARLNPNGSVTVRNVPSYRAAAKVAVEVEGHGAVVGDVAWGGNWFFLVPEPRQPIALSRLEQLTEFAWRIRRALAAGGITGDDGREIDHIELFGPPSAAGAHSRNFVLCPGKAYDRSPCGTGTSAKLACLYAEGKLRPGEVWRQESIVGSVFEGSITVEGGRVLPEITGYAYVNAEAELILDEADPFCHGIPSSCQPPTT